MSDAGLRSEIVDRALEGIPEMAGSKLIAKLSDGPTNSSFHIRQGAMNYVLRLDKPEVHRLGLNRRNEARVSAAVAVAGLAPEPVYVNTAAGIYLRHFLPGRSWSEADICRPDNLSRLAVLLRNLHRLEPVGAAFEPLAAAGRYAAFLGGEAAWTILDRAENLSRKMAGSERGLSLCHNDLVCQNVLEGERLMLIDWEYAGIGDPFFDLAVIVQHHGLGTELKRGFLDAWLGRQATAQESRHLDMQCEFYACLLQLWDLRIAQR